MITGPWERWGRRGLGPRIAVLGLAEAPGVHDLQAVEPEVKREMRVPDSRKSAGASQAILAAVCGAGCCGWTTLVRGLKRPSRWSRIAPRIIALSLLLAALLPATGFAADKSDMLRQDMRKLWEDHIT